MRRWSYFQQVDPYVEQDGGQLEQWEAQSSDGHRAELGQGRQLGPSDGTPDVLWLLSIEKDGDYVHETDLSSDMEVPASCFHDEVLPWAVEAIRDFDGRDGEESDFGWTC